MMNTKLATCFAALSLALQSCFITVPSTNTGGTTNPQCMRVMTPAEHSNACATIKAKPFKDEQLTVAKQAVRGACMTAEQIKAVMLVMPFEDTRLDFAIFAHTYCTDKHNYYIVNDGFTFKSSVDKLNSALGL